MNVFSQLYELTNYPFKTLNDNNYISIFTNYLQFEQTIYNCTLLILYGSRLAYTIDYIRSTNLLVYLYLYYMYRIEDLDLFDRLFARYLHSLVS